MTHCDKCKENEIIERINDLEDALSFAWPKEKERIEWDIFKLEVKLAILQGV